MANVLNIKVSEFEPLPCYYTDFRTNTLVKDMNLIPPAMGQIAQFLFFHKGRLNIRFGFFV